MNNPPSHAKDNRSSDITLTSVICVICIVLTHCDFTVHALIDRGKSVAGRTAENAQISMINLMNVYMYTLANRANRRRCSTMTVTRRESNGFGRIDVNKRGFLMITNNELETAADTSGAFRFWKPIQVTHCSVAHCKIIEKITITCINLVCQTHGKRVMDT